MNANRSRRNARLAPIPLGPRALPGGVGTPAPALAPPPGCGEEEAIGTAAAWLIRRHRVRPNLAATVALHAGLGERA